MTTNKCYSCDAHNTVKSKTCGNCGADISTGGHFKRWLRNVFLGILVLAGFALYNMFQK